MTTSETRPLGALQAHELRHLIYKELGVWARLDADNAQLREVLRNKDMRPIEGNIVDAYRDFLSEFVAKNKDRLSIPCKGNCHDHEDGIVLCCYHRLGGTMPAKKKTVTKKMLKVVDPVEARHILLVAMGYGDEVYVQRDPVSLLHDNLLVAQEGGAAVPFIEADLSTMGTEAVMLRDGIMRYLLDIQAFAKGEDVTPMWPPGNDQTLETDEEETSTTVAAAPVEEAPTTVTAAPAVPPTTRKEAPVTETPKHAIRKPLVRRLKPGVPDGGPVAKSDVPTPDVKKAPVAAPAQETKELPKANEAMPGWATAIMDELTAIRNDLRDIDARVESIDDKTACLADISAATNGLSVQQEYLANGIVALANGMVSNEESPFMDISEVPTPEATFGDAGDPSDEGEDDE